MKAPIKRGVAAVAAVAVAGAAVAGYVLWDRSQARAAFAAELMAAAPDEIPDDARLYLAAQSLGERAYAQHCASCHGVGLEGDSSQGHPALNNADWLYGAGYISEIERTISFGIRADHPGTWHESDMPAYSSPNPYSVTPDRAHQTLTAQEIEDVANYTLSLSESPHDPESAARGREIYNGKGLCWDCHAHEGFGNPGIGASNLTDDIWLYGGPTLAEVMVSIAAGRKGVCPAWEGELDPATIRALAVFIESRSEKDPFGVPPWEYGSVE